MNWESLDKILKAEVFVHMDGQLKATHLILDYIPISKNFQGPKCIIRARDPRLQWISIAALEFLLPGPISEGTLAVTPFFEGVPKVRASSLQQATQITTLYRPANVEEEEMVEITDFEDEFEVFNCSFSPKTSTPDLGPPFSPILNKMGIQCKPKSSLLDLIESKPGRDAPEKTVQTKPPTPSPALPSQTADLKRKREPTGKELMGAGQTLPPLQGQGSKDC